MALQNNVLETDWDGVETTFHRDRHLSVCVHVVAVVGRLSNAGRNWRVVRNLLGKIGIVVAH
jgi:hypothetical protein